MTATLGPRCLCTHSAWRHVRDTDRCRALGCTCRGFRDAADELGDAIARHPAGRARIPDHLRTDDMPSYLRAKGER